MKKSILIFSATKHLFETIISSEVKLLSEEYNVVVLSEYPDIPLLDQALTIPFYRPQDVKRRLPFIRSFYAIANYKKLSAHLIETYNIHAIIIHQDNEFYTNFFLHWINSKRKIKVLLRRPSVVIDPQQDFSWQWRLGSGSRLYNQLKSLLIKVYFDLFLSTIFLKKPTITRTAFWKTDKRYWVERKKRIYNISLCYSESCSKYLSTIYEDSHVIMNPLLQDELSITNPNSKDAVLFILSNDNWSVAAANNITIDKAQDYVNDRINQAVQAFVANGLEVHVRFKHGEGSIAFIDHDIRHRVSIVDNNISIYEQVKGYKIIAGFVTTPLWLLATVQAPKKIYSFQLIDTTFYNYFMRFPRVTFIKYHKKGYKLHSLVDEERDSSVSTPSIQNSILHYI